jgi:hypothetical protein
MRLSNFGFEFSNLVWKVMVKVKVKVSEWVAQKGGMLLSFLIKVVGKDFGFGISHFEFKSRV